MDVSHFREERQVRIDTMVYWPPDGHRLKSKARCNIISGSQVTAVLPQERPGSPHSATTATRVASISSTSCKDCETVASGAKHWDQQDSIGRATPLRRDFWFPTRVIGRGRMKRSRRDDSGHVPVTMHMRLFEQRDKISVALVGNFDPSMIASNRLTAEGKRMIRRPSKMCSELTLARHHAKTAMSISFLRFACACTVVPMGSSLIFGIVIY
jgi:hypothetical protein